MSEFIVPIIIGLIIGSIIAITDLVLYFKFDFDFKRDSGLSFLSPLAILVGVIYGFFGDGNGD